MSKTIKLTETELHRLVKDAAKRIIAEGIDVDEYGNVTMTDRHEKLADTSADNNPTVITNIVPNIKVWSIFKRIDDDWGDGNPLLYALKGEHGYRLTNPTKFYSRMDYVINKFFEGNNGVDVTIAVPSRNNLNKIFAEAVAKHCKNPQYIDNLFIKMSTEEVGGYIRQQGSLFQKYYKNNYKDKYNELRGYFRKMPYGTFQFHKIDDMQMRKVIEHTIKLADEYYGHYVDAINDKNILIVDDSLTLGNTIKESCKIISTAYTPKSITVLTLFSPLYNQGGETLKNH